MFREIPPKELVEDILLALGFTGFTDRRIFFKDSLDFTSLEQYLPILEPYYYPCKAKRSGNVVFNLFFDNIRGPFNDTLYSDLTSYFK